MNEASIREQYQRQGLLRQVGLGQRPACVVVDFSRGFTDPACPLGADYGPQLEATRKVLEVFRTRGWPTVFTTVVYDPEDTGRLRFIQKIPSLELLARDSAWVQLDARLGVLPHEKVIEKKMPSAFFDTDLHSWLLEREVDTVIVCGATTSGCVRATALDALQHNYRLIVPRACVGDRAQGPHEANLLDIDAKYGDVVELDALLEQIRKVQD